MSKKGATTTTTRCALLSTRLSSFLMQVSFFFFFFLLLRKHLCCYIFCPLFVVPVLDYDGNSSNASAPLESGINKDDFKINLVDFLLVVLKTIDNSMNAFQSKGPTKWTLMKAPEL